VNGKSWKQGKGDNTLFGFIISIYFPYSLIGGSKERKGEDDPDTTKGITQKKPQRE
jgi:hypothetical protein